MRRLIPAITTVLLSAALWIAGDLGAFAVTFVLLLLVVGLASGWPTLLGLPTPRGSTTVLALCGAVAILVVLTTSPGLDQPLTWLAPTLACSIVATFMHQLLRRDMRPRLVDSVAGVVAGVVVVQSAAGWLPAMEREPGDAVVGLATLAVCALGLLLPLRRRTLTPLLWLLGAGVAVLSSILVPAVSLGSGLLVALVVVTLMLAFDVMFHRLPSASSRQAAMSVATSGVCVTGLVVYMVGTVLA